MGSHVAQPQPTTSNFDPTCPTIYYDSHIGWRVAKKESLIVPELTQNPLREIWTHVYPNFDVAKVVCLVLESSDGSTRGI